MKIPESSGYSTQIAIKPTQKQMRIPLELGKIQILGSSGYSTQSTLKIRIESKLHFQLRIWSNTNPKYH